MAIVTLRAGDWIIIVTAKDAEGVIVGEGHEQATVVIDETTPVEIPVSLPVLVEFSDGNLEDAVRKTINKPEGDIYTSDLWQLIEFSVISKGIKDISGVQHCVYIKRLNLERNEISDISALADLTNLSYLDLGSNQISNIEVLKNLKNLWYLDLSYNKIDNINALAGLSRLSALKIKGNPDLITSPGSEARRIIDELIAEGCNVEFD